MIFKIKTKFNKGDFVKIKLRSGTYADLRGWYGLSKKEIKELLFIITFISVSSDSDNATYVEYSLKQISNTNNENDINSLNNFGAVENDLIKLSNKAMNIIKLELL